MSDYICCICGGYLHGGVAREDGWAHEWCAASSDDYTPEWEDQDYDDPQQPTKE